MKIIISGLNERKEDVFYSGHTEEKAIKGLGSGALTGTNSIPKFLTDPSTAKEISTYIDAKRIMTEIIDAIRYEDIKGIEMISIHILKEDKNER